ncbi:MAG: PAS domain S-box protein [Syntrophotaleaceae bacterium]
MDSFFLFPSVLILLLAFFTLAGMLLLLLSCRRFGKKALLALQISEKRFETLLEGISDALVGVNEKGVIVTFNNAAEKLFGYTKDEMIGGPLERLIPERHREKHRQVIGQFFVTRWDNLSIGEAVEVPALHKDGREILVELTLSLLVGNNSRNVLACIRDISRRKADEDALRLSEERFREMADLLPQSIFESDRDGTVTFANRMAFELTGTKFDFAKEKRNLFEWISPEDRDRAAANIARVLGGKTLPDEKYVLIREDGTRLSVMVAASPIWRGHQIVGARGIVMDISERLRTERLLRESGEQFKQLFQKYQALLDNIPDAITLLAPDLTVIRSNLGAAKLLGKPVTHLPGKSCTDLWVGCSLLEEGCPVRKSFRTGKTEKNIMKTADGRSWRIRAFPVVDESGETVEVIAHTRDVTRQLQMEQEATRANHLASLGELAAGVAHEINNPINGIINYAQILTDDPRQSEENRDILQCIIDEGDRIANIVSNLLTFARARKEKQNVISIGDVLAATLPLAGAQLQKDHIQVRLDIDPGLPMVMAHTQQIQQVILNLISNARYALNQRYPGADENKILQIFSEAGMEAGIPMVRLVFLDQGTGIPAILLPMVMDPFYTTKPSGQGTGLGLSICHGILKDHGGNLKIESVEGDYTSVAMELPAA